MSYPVVTFEMENGDIIKAELYPEIAPNSVKNFISLIKKGFYVHTYIHQLRHQCICSHLQADGKSP